MTTHFERIANAFFPQDGVGTDNVKFFLGWNRFVTKAQLAEQLERAEVQIRNNPALLTTALDGDLAVTTI